MNGSHTEELETEDRLNLQTWTFQIVDDTVYLDEYVIMFRPSRRHKYRLKYRWQCGRSEPRPLVLQYMIENALKFFRAKLRWEE